jgi:hypothetical protein
MFDNDGNTVYEPQDCRRFITKPNHLLVSVVDEGNDSCIRMYYDNSIIDINSIEDLFSAFRSLASKFNVTFAARASNKKITPKEFSTYSSVTESETIMLYHTSKTSYLTLDNAKMIAKKSVNEGYNSIQIEDASSNRFQFPVNDLEAAIDMTNHVNGGGSFADAVGQQILRMASHYSELKSAKICESYAEYKSAGHFERLTEARVAMGVDDEACPTCKGTGGNEEPCDSCGGTGIETTNVLGKKVSKLAWEKLVKTGEVAFTGTPTVPSDKPINPNVIYYFDLVVPYIENLSLSNLCSYISDRYAELPADKKTAVRSLMVKIIKASGLKISEGFMTSSSAIREFLEWTNSFSTARLMEADGLRREDVLLPHSQIDDFKNEVMIKDDTEGLNETISVIDAGYMKHKHDTDGLENYLRTVELIPANGHLFDSRDFENLMSDDEARAEWDGPIYGYYINLDERGDFYADVRDENDQTVFELKSEDEEPEYDEEEPEYDEEDGELEEAVELSYSGYMGSAKGGVTGSVHKTAMEAAKAFFEKYPTIKKINVVPVTELPNGMVSMYYRAPSYKDVTPKNMAEMLADGV